jgi:hypothetical protein
MVRVNLSHLFGQPEVRKGFMMKGRYVVISYYLIFSLFLVFTSLFKPLLNWDMIPYVGAAKSFDIHDKEALHRYVYSELQEFVPEKTYQVLTSSSEYRDTVSKDPEALLLPTWCRPFR